MGIGEWSGWDPTAVVRGVVLRRAVERCLEKGKKSSAGNKWMGE